MGNKFAQNPTKSGIPVKNSPALLKLTALLGLSGCFAIPLPEYPASADPARALNANAPVSYFVVLPEGAPGKWSFERGAGERLAGSGALGHQFVLFGIPVTRLYLERPRDEFLGELALSSTAAPHDSAAVSNLPADELMRLLGPATRTIRLRFRDLSVSAYDLFFLRRLAVSGIISAELNGRSAVDLPFSKDRYGKSGAAEALSEILRESIEDSLAGLRNPRSRVSRLSLNGPEEIAPILICPPPALIGEDAQLSVQRGWERALRTAAKPFISFRRSCPKTILGARYRLTADRMSRAVSDESVSLAGHLTLTEESAAGVTATIAEREIETALPLERRSSEPEKITTELVASELLRQFLQQ